MSVFSSVFNDEEYSVLQEVTEEPDYFYNLNVIGMKLLKKMVHSWPTFVSSGPRFGKLFVDNKLWIIKQLTNY